ncbi:MAG: dephospho-CoA kinase [Dehalococcoidia bacterium]|nr:dephospho-CoA kinase [Dehalococcoidia bacterium]
MIVIGLIGAIGSGKSTIAGFMQELGARVIDADKVGHQTYLPNSLSWQSIVDAFGERVISADQSIDRKVLGDIVFNEPTKLSILNGITHPLIYEAVTEQLEELRRNNTKMVVMEVLETVFLTDPKWKILANEIWVAVAPEDVIIERLEQSRLLSRSQIKARLAVCMPQAEKLHYADRVINTNIPLQELREKITSICTEISELGPALQQRAES